jgi:hypothetical protein
MRLLVSGATKTLRQYAPHPNLGHLLTPANGNRIEVLLATGLPIAIDNAAFAGFNPAAFRQLLEALMPYATDPATRDRFLWCAVPDVVGDSHATLEQYGEWAGMVGWAGLPRAFVAQDGCEAGHFNRIEWHARCIFIGGTTKWKEGPGAAAVIREAKRRGKWIHVGRVNTMRRLQHFEALGVDSFDGSQFSMFPNTYIPRWLARLESGAQRGLWEAA